MLLHIAYKGLQRNNEKTAELQSNIYLSVLQVIDVFLAYSDFTVSVAYNAKRHFQYNFLRLPVK